MMRIRARIYQALLLVGVLLCFAPARVLAHGGHGPTNIQTFTQAVGPYEMAVTLELPPSVPAPLYLTITPQSDLIGATMTFRAAPRGQSFDGASAATVQALPGQQGSYFSELQIERAGDWDMEVRVQGPKGTGVARIPFEVAVPPLAAGTIGLFVSIGGLVVLMIISIMLGVVTHRRRRPVPGWANWLIGQGMFACLILAAVFGVQQFTAQIQQAQAASMMASQSAAGAYTAGVGRPHVNMAVGTEPAIPAAGQPLTLTLDLNDGSTGRPVEDIVPHHDALVHLVVISADGGDFKHIHPPRVEAGRYAIELTPDRPGRYTAYAELQRLDSGTQVIARDFEIGGTASNAPPPTTEGLGIRTIGDVRVEVTSSVTPLKAGKQATFTFSFSKDGVPINDLQPWLGMGGHMMARSVNDTTFAHVHAQGPMAPGGLLESGFVYGPDIQFVYTFPQPGRYQVWGQVRRSNQIITVPLVVEVQ